MIHNNSMKKGLVLKQLSTQVFIFVLGLTVAACNISAEPLNRGNTSATKGSPDAPLLMVAYSDFQCPACARAEPVIHEILDKYGDKVFFVFRHFPLQAHRHAFSAAVASECAREQDTFWPYHDLLFSKQGEWGNNQREISLKDPLNVFSRYAKQLKLDLSSFNQCLQSKEIRELVKSSKREGEKFRVTSTPTFFLGNKRVVGGRSLKANYNQIIEQALQKQ